MVQLRITHETCYDYAQAVDIAQHTGHLHPLETASQQLVSHALWIDPQPAQCMELHDAFGNTQIFFSLQNAHQHLKVTAQSVVVTRARTPPPSSITWEQVQQRFRYQSTTPFDAASEFVFPSPYVPRHADFFNYARPSFTDHAGLYDAVHDLMQRIHSEFRYESYSTEVNTPALDALAQRKGVCQDFAHIMLACLRAWGLSARYVSGYLLTQVAPGQTRLVGSDASHAWVSVYLPDWPEGARWCDFDPTNNRDGWGSPAEDYVTLAIGRDYADVSPLRGVIHGGGRHTLTVGVTVEPIEIKPVGADTTATGHQ